MGRDDTRVARGLFKARAIPRLTRCHAPGERYQRASYAGFITMRKTAISGAPVDTEPQIIQRRDSDS